MAWRGRFWPCYSDFHLASVTISGYIGAVIRAVSLVASGADDLESHLLVHEARNLHANVAVIFVGENICDGTILRPLLTRGIRCFAACAAETITGSRVQRDQLSVLLLELPENSFRLQVFRSGNPASAGKTIGQEIAAAAALAFKKPALLLLIAGGGLDPRPEELLRDVRAALPQAPVYGGMASSYGRFARPPVFDEQGIPLESAAVALILDSAQMHVSGLAVSGWRELGTAKTITRATGNKVYSIEGIPAVEFYRRYFGLLAAADAQNNLDPELRAASEYLLLLRRADGTEVLRAALRFDPVEGAVYYGGEIPEGAQARFCSPNVESTMAEAISEMQSFRERHTAARADAVLLFNCAIRARAYGPLVEREIERIYDLWHAPVVGFHSWGEIGDTPGMQCDFHNTVISTVTFSWIGNTGAATPAQQPQEPKEASVTSQPDAAESPEQVLAELAQLRREKRILSNFLRMTAGDLEAQTRRADELLQNMLPVEIAGRLKSGQHRIADQVPQASVLFADLSGFTSWAASTPAERIVDVLDELFSLFDESASSAGVEKIKTIGDAYMAAAGVPAAADDHAARCVRLARAMFSDLARVNKSRGLALQMRIGIHTGPVVAGVIGRRKYTYDLWGDTVNTAQRLESAAAPGSILASEQTYALLTDTSGFVYRGAVPLKGRASVIGYSMQVI